MSRKGVGSAPVRQGDVDRATGMIVQRIAAALAEVDLGKLVSVALRVGVTPAEIAAIFVLAAQDGTAETVA